MLREDCWLLYISCVRGAVLQTICQSDQRRIFCMFYIATCKFRWSSVHCVVIGGRGNLKFTLLRPENLYVILARHNVLPEDI